MKREEAWTNTKRTLDLTSTKNVNPPEDMKTKRRRREDKEELLSN